MSRDEYRRFAEERLRFWQNILGLTGWDIQLKTGQVDGKVVYDAQYLCAQVIVNPRLTPKQLEYVIVHECLHLVFAEYNLLLLHFAPQLFVQQQTSAPLDAVENRIIEIITRALLGYKLSQLDQPAEQQANPNPQANHREGKE